MITHVAEAGEDRGRVVFAVTAAERVSDTAIDAAIRFAEAFQSELESLFIEDRRVFQLGAYPFVREVSCSGRSLHPLSTGDIERETRFAANATQRLVRERARRSDIRLRLSAARDEPVAALATACAERGPWNIIVLGEPLLPGSGAVLRQIFFDVRGTTGVVVVGRHAQRSTGPVILVVEDIERLPPMLSAASRLAAGQGTTRLLLIGEDREKLALMEDQARLALAEKPALKFEVSGLVRADQSSVAERLRRMNGGFIVARYGGLVVPPEDRLGPLVSIIECPVLLVR